MSAAPLDVDMFIGYLNEKMIDAGLEDINSSLNCPDWNTLQFDMLIFGRGDQDGCELTEKVVREIGSAAINCGMIRSIYGFDTRPRY